MRQSNPQLMTSELEIQYSYLLARKRFGIDKTTVYIYSYKKKDVIKTNLYADLGKQCIWSLYGEIERIFLELCI